MKCPICGTEIMPGTAFCPTCGTPVNNQQTVSQNAYGQPTPVQPQGQPQVQPNPYNQAPYGQPGYQQGPQGPYNQPGYIPPNGQYYQQGAPYQQEPPKKKKKKFLWLIILLAVLFGGGILVGLFLLIMFMIFLFSDEGGGSTQVSPGNGSTYEYYADDYTSRGGSTTELPDNALTSRNNTAGWLQSPTGSAKYLDGSTLLLSIYVDDNENTWDSSEKAITMEKMRIATDYLKAEGASYGKEVNLIYDTDVYPDLAYEVTYSGNTGTDSEDESYDLLDFATEYIDKNVDTQALMQKYNVDSIGYICYLNNEGTSYTFPYWVGDDDIYYYECCFMFFEYDGEYEAPATYAHEILHLFGARDLYTSNESDGITVDFVKYIENNYSNEIMLTTYDENWNAIPDRVTNDLTDITAYFIGWKDTIPELSTYPSIASTFPASFSTANTNAGDDYSYYYAGETDNFGVDSNYGCRDGSCSYDYDDYDYDDYDYYYDGDDYYCNYGDDDYYYYWDDYDDYYDDSYDDYSFWDWLFE